VDALKAHHVPEMMRRINFIAACCLSYLLLTFSFAAVSNESATPAAQDTHPTEYQVEAAYLYNFGKFVRWPDATAPRSDAAFTICVLGRNPFDGGLKAVVAGQTINGHLVNVKEVSDITNAEDCQIVYVKEAETKRFREVLNRVRRMPLVTVSDAGDFLDRGGIIQFVLVNDRVRFAVNLEAARIAGVELSAELLKVAVKVTGSDAAKEHR